MYFVLGFRLTDSVLLSLEIETRVMKFKYTHDVLSLGTIIILPSYGYILLRSRWERCLNMKLKIILRNLNMLQLHLETKALLNLRVKRECRASRTSSRSVMFVSPRRLQFNLMISKSILTAKFSPFFVSVFVYWIHTNPISAIRYLSKICTQNPVLSKSKVYAVLSFFTQSAA